MLTKAKKPNVNYRFLHEMNKADLSLRCVQNKLKKYKRVSCLSRKNRILRTEWITLKLGAGNIQNEIKNEMTNRHFHISMAIVRNCVYLFVMLQTSCYTLFFHWKTSKWEFFKYFLSLLVQYPVKILSYEIDLFFFEKSGSGNFETLWWKCVVLHFGHRYVILLKFFFPVTTYWIFLFVLFY